jgi:hypothetical protein
MSAHDVSKLLNLPAFDPTRVRRTPGGDVPQLRSNAESSGFWGRADPGTPYTDYRAPAGAVLFQRDNGSVVEPLRFNLYAVNSPQLAAIV